MPPVTQEIKLLDAFCGGVCRFDCLVGGEGYLMKGVVLETIRSKPATAGHLLKGILQQSARVGKEGGGDIPKFSFQSTTFNYNYNPKTIHEHTKQ